MNRFLYNVILHTFAAPFLAAYYAPRIMLGGKYRRSLSGKFGRLPADLHPESLKRPRIWFHAVSVGEVVALGPLVKAVKQLAPEASIVVSTGTETGQDKAHESIPQIDGYFYLPLDFPAFVNRVVERIEPDLFVLMETELWPNLVHSLKEHGTIVALANGRISDRSFPRYRRLKWFFSSTLEKIDLFLMGSEIDRERITAMGARPENVRVTGNTKVDAALGKVPVQSEADMREMLELRPSDTVLVAGSTHPGEHEIVLDAYQTLKKKFPALILVLVPRHLERVPSILSSMKDRGIEGPFLRSSADIGEHRNGRSVVVVDRMGELFKVFSVASVVFIGGSLVPKGGQNILEPAAWGKVVFFGPSMEDFREARELLLRTGAGREVKDGDDLVRRIDEALSNPEATRAAGARGRAEILRHTGSAVANAELLVGLLRSNRKAAMS